MILALSRLLMLVPLEAALALARALAWIWYWLLPIRVGVARANIRRVFPDLSPREQKRMVKRCLRNQAMNAIELLRMPHYTKELDAQLCEYEGFEELDRALASKIGVIAVTAHVGNIDMLACSAALRGYPAHAIAKTVSWKPANDFVRAVRERTGLTIVPTRSSRDLIRAALAKGEVAAFAFDQHMAKHRAIVCDFFGQLASTSPNPVRFGFETGAAVFPVISFCKGETGRHLIRAYPRLHLETPHETLDANIRHNTERLNRYVESWIREQPHQWLWLHRRWKVQDDPSGWEIPPKLAHLTTRRA